MTDVTSSKTFTDILNQNGHDDRKKLINLIEKKLDGKIISYIENSEHPFAFINMDDAIPFEDLLLSVGKSKKGFLILNSTGGDGNAAEKLLFMCRERFTESFTVIVPNFAKSAATMMCLGADKIMMGYLAELGPIDPQISVPKGSPIPARSFIDGLEMVRENVKTGDPPTMYLSMLNKISPELISLCNSAIDDAKCFAINWLTRYMLKDDHDHAKKVSEWLSDGKTYKSHGKMINYDEAKKTLKLNAELIDSNSELWHWIWKLYVSSVVYMKAREPNAAKLFESHSVSLTSNVALPD